MNMICTQCNKSFYEKPARVKAGKGKFCSLNCRVLDKRSHYYGSKQEMIKLYKTKTLREIASIYNCSPTTVKNIMIEDNVPRRDMHDRYYPSGNEHSRWKGGCKTGAHQYLMVKTENGIEYVHRLVATKKYNRAIKSDEQVHHIDLNPKNNRPDNLVILKTKDHIALHANLRRKVAV